MTTRFVDGDDPALRESTDPALHTSLQYCRTHLAALLSLLPPDTDWPEYVTIAVEMIRGFPEAPFGILRAQEGPALVLDPLTPQAARLMNAQLLLGSSAPDQVNPGALAWAKRNLWEHFVLMVCRRDRVAYRAWSAPDQEYGAIMAMRAFTPQDEAMAVILDADPRAAGRMAELAARHPGGQIFADIGYAMPTHPQGNIPSWCRLTGVQFTVNGTADAEDVPTGLGDG